MTGSPTWTPPSSFRDDLLERYGLACPPQWGPPRRPQFPTFGPKAAKILAALGTPPMPHQRYILDVALEYDPARGVMCYRNAGLSIMRQQGKTQTLLGVMTHRMAAWKRQRITYAAQTRGMARQRWEDEFIPALEASKALVSKFDTRKTNGNEAIIWRATRSLLGITSNTEKAGHGPPLDFGAIDEAFAHEDDRLEQAMSPAMLTRPMAQLWWASAGGTEKSVWLNKKRAAGRELIERAWETGVWPATCYIEWFAPDELHRDDPATWHGCMPALCPTPAPCRCDPAGVWHHTVFESTIRAELESMEAAEFDRAYLNRTRKYEPPVDPNVPSKEWPGRAELHSRRGDDLAFAIDVTPTRDHASIAVYSPRADGLGHVELVDRRPGTDWIRPALLRLRQLWDPIAVGIDGLGPAGALIDDLEKAGIKRPADPDKPRRGDLAVATTRDVTSACGQFADAVRQAAIVHIDQAELNAALFGARTRTVSEAWAWARRHASVDISPLVAVTLARWAYLNRVDRITAHEIEPGVWVF